LFLAIIPLLYAPETLPEKSMKDRELKNYLETAQKFAQKETEKKTIQYEKSERIRWGKRGKPRKAKIP